MKIPPGKARHHLPNADDTDGLVIRSKNPVLAKVMEERKKRFRQIQDQDSNYSDSIALNSRVIVIEGVSGSGKDTFQAYLKNKLADRRDVYDFAEGELLHSWKHIPIEGVLDLKVEFMRIFVKYLKQIISRDENAVFLLNRLHLSTYASIKTRRPELIKKYDQIIDVLRLLPVHVFLLYLDKNEMEKRSLHSERPGVWPKLQRQMITNDGFQTRVEKYISQQCLMIEAAKRHPIPYSLIKFFGPDKIEPALDHVAESSNGDRGGVGVNATGSNITRRKRHLPHTV
jgi:thymidylate kinase